MFQFTPIYMSEPLIRYFCPGNCLIVVAINLHVFKMKVIELVLISRLVQAADAVVSISFSASRWQSIIHLWAQHACRTVVWLSQIIPLLMDPVFYLHTVEWIVLQEVTSLPEHIFQKEADEVDHIWRLCPDILCACFDLFNIRLSTLEIQNRSMGWLWTWWLPAELCHADRLCRSDRPGGTPITTTYTLAQSWLGVALRHDCAHPWSQEMLC